jgi:hypothetical protein
MRICVWVSHLRKIGVAQSLRYASVLRIERLYLSSPGKERVLGRSTYLEVDDYEDNQNSREQVGEVGGILSVEGVLEGINFVALGEEEVEESDDCSFELSALISSDCDGGEALPEDVLADVGSDEEGDA